MEYSFTAHNIGFEDGAKTIPTASELLADGEGMRSLRRLMNFLCSSNPTGHSVVDVGCLEGGYSAEFARWGMNATGIEVREVNYNCCEQVRSRLGLPNLAFIQDDARNIGKYGPFDITFCAGLLYHLDQPLEFLRSAAAVTRRAIIVNTHFATRLPNLRYGLSWQQSWNEGLLGRWYREFPRKTALTEQGKLRWTSWKNHRSFWIRREWLLQAIADCGFKLVFEEHDHLLPSIADGLTKGYARIHDRGVFVGVKA